jgi:hypothetical protein
MKGMF